jgi:hypothetical protein
MRKIVFILYICLITGNLLNAQTTTYSKGVFTVKVEQRVSVSEEKMNATVDKFIDQYKNNLPLLDGWAIKGLKLRGEKDNFIIFNIKSHKPDAQNIDGVMDIKIVPLNKNYQNVTYDVALFKTKKSDFEYDIHYSLTNCTEVINSAKAVINIKVSDNGNAAVTLVANVQLTKSYNMLMSRKQFEENLSWRFEKFVTNLIAEANK